MFGVSLLELLKRNGVVMQDYDKLVAKTVLEVLEEAGEHGIEEEQMWIEVEKKLKSKELKLDESPN
jgi:hypothetical protein